MLLGRSDVCIAIRMLQSLSMLFWLLFDQQTELLISVSSLFIFLRPDSRSFQVFVVSLPAIQFISQYVLVVEVVRLTPLVA